MYNKDTNMRLHTLAVLTAAVSLSTGWAGDDPYLWLEDIQGERALAWVRRENESTAERLESKPIFDELHAQARAALNANSRLPEVYQEEGWLYNTWKDEDYPRGVFRRTTLEEFPEAEPEWEVVIDVDALNAKEGKQWVFKGMDCLPGDPEHCMVSLSPGGGDAVVIREFNSVAKSFVEGGFVLPLSKGGTGWIDADTLYVSTDFGAGTMTGSGYPRIARRWERGTPLASAETVHEGLASSIWTYAIRMRSDGPDLDLVQERLTFWTTQWYQLSDNGKQALELPATAVVQGAFKGRLVISLKDAWARGEVTYPQGAVLVAEVPALRAGQDGGIDVLFEPDGTTVVQAVEETDDAILLSVLDNVRGKIFRYTPGQEGQWERHQVGFPGGGSLRISSTDADSGSFFAEYESFTSPPALYYVSAGDWQPVEMKAQDPTFDGSKYRTGQYFATSSDGTRVPYFVVMSKDAELNGKNPTHIFSYGGFRNALTPSYSGSYEPLYGAYGKLWLDRGGVFVLANIRGGGEFGPAWHAAALKENKVRSYEDFEAVVGDLFRRGITSPQHLGIEGRSNGGLLVGALMTRNPDMYGAVICGVPLLDMKRYHKLLAGASWVAEYGNPDIPEEWAYIKQYSPYQNVRKSTDYPPIFFFGSTRDDRVHPGHGRKMAALLQELDQEVYYYENTEGGHGGSSTNDQLAYRLALAYTHLWTHLK
jgi:prolyl oligopeptidase